MEQKLRIELFSVRVWSHAGGGHWTEGTRVKGVKNKK